MNIGVMLLIIRCPCGGIIQKDFTTLVVTSQGMLCFAGVCPSCGLIVGAGKLLTEMVEDCKTITPPEEVFSESDEAWLKAMNKGFGGVQ